MTKDIYVAGKHVASLQGDGDVPAINELFISNCDVRYEWTTALVWSSVRNRGVFPILYVMLSYLSRIGPVDIHL